MNRQQHFERLAIDLDQERSRHLKDFLEILTAKRATTGMLIDAARRSSQAGSIELWFARDLGEFREITDPCSNRTFLVTAFRNKLYLLEEIV